METKKILWYNLAFMAFSTVWGFGNVLNGFVYFNGLQVIFSWVLMFALYFVPYALMVGELGSAFKELRRRSQFHDPRDDRIQKRLLCRLDLLGMSHHVYRQQGQRWSESIISGDQLGIHAERPGLV